MKRGCRVLPVIFIVVIPIILSVSFVSAGWLDDFFGNMFGDDKSDLEGELGTAGPISSSTLSLYSSSAPSSVNLGDSFQIKCDFGIENLPCVQAFHGTTKCTWANKWEGTAGVFNCVAAESGTIDNYCTLFNYAPDSRCVFQQNKIKSTNVIDSNFVLLISSSTPSSVKKGDKFEIRCDFGIEWLNCVQAKHGNNNCAYKGYDGTESIWECTASNAGTRENYCNLFKYSGNPKCLASQTNKIQSTNVVDPGCTPNWQCSSWSTCVNSQKTRTCTDTNSCGTTTGKPATTQSCGVTNPCANKNCNDNNLCTYDSCSNGNCINTPKICPSGQTCINGNCVTTANTNCVAKNCLQLEKNCGIIDNECGTSLNCGTCGNYEVCSNGNCLSTIPLCTKDNWNFNLTPQNCPSSGKQTKTWTKIGFCKGGITKTSDEEISCDVNAIICTNWTYTNWSLCKPGNFKTREIVSSLPNECEGGTPLLSGNCELCTPDCNEKTCGADGCGGGCGICESGQTCSNGNCISLTEQKVVEQIPVEQTSCIPKSCNELKKTCGDWNDGCGTSLNCGTCATEESCKDGNCVKDLVNPCNLMDRILSFFRLAKCDYNEITNEICKSVSTNVALNKPITKIPENNPSSLIIDLQAEYMISNYKIICGESSNENKGTIHFYDGDCNHLTIKEYECSRKTVSEDINPPIKTRTIRIDAASPIGEGGINIEEFQAYSNCIPLNNISEGEIQSCCKPNCDEKACGSDGCGGSCGTCGSGQTCNEDGKCQTCNKYGRCCVAKTCFELGKSCGAVSDGCGGFLSCGTCDSQNICNAGQCVERCFRDCQEKECGSNGCFGNCGACGNGQTCSNNVCVSLTDSCANKNCNDNNPCTGDSCNNGKCVNTPKICPSGQSCDEEVCFSSIENCAPEWKCSEWDTDCVDGQQTRTCTNLNDCIGVKEPLQTLHNPYSCLSDVSCTGQKLSNLDYHTQGTIQWKNKKKSSFSTTSSSTSSASTGSKTDFCFGDNNQMLRKYFCTDSFPGYGYKDYVCPNGCDKGACMKEDVVNLEVMTYNAVDIIQTGPTVSITLIGLLSNLKSGHNANSDVWFEIGTTKDYSFTTPRQTLVVVGSFGASVHNLAPGTTYHYRAVASNNIKTTYGQDLTFTTPPVATPEPQPRPLPGCPTCACCGMTCFGQKSSEIDYYQQGIVRWWQYTSNLYWPETLIGVREDTCIDSNTLRKYYCYEPQLIQQIHFIPYQFKDFACPNGCKDGACIKTGGFQLKTNSATSVKTYSATLNGVLPSLNGNSEVIVWFEGGSAEYSFSYRALNWENLGRKTLTSPGKFNVDVSGLKPFITYYYRTVAATKTTIEYGPWQRFTTVSVPTDGITTMTPSPFLSQDIFQVTTWNFSGAIKQTSADLQGTYFINTFSGYLPGKPNINAWFEIGTTDSYGRETAKQELKEVIPGRYFTIEEKGLSPGTTYHYRAVASAKGFGTVYGPDKTFTTKTYV